MKKDMFWNIATCNCKNAMHSSAIMHDDVRNWNEEETKTIPTNFNEKNIICKAQNFCILFDFLLITIALLTAVNIYCFLINYKAKQKHEIKTGLCW